MARALEKYWPDKTGDPILLENRDSCLAAIASSGVKKLDPKIPDENDLLHCWPVPLDILHFRRRPKSDFRTRLRGS